jgi:hypothetical protein
MSSLTPAEQHFLTQFLSTRASARRLLKSVASIPLYREQLLSLFLSTFRSGWRAEQCGDSGYRLSALDPWQRPATISLTGLHRHLSRICWHPDRVMPRGSTTPTLLQEMAAHGNEFGNLVFEGSSDSTQKDVAKKTKRKRAASTDKTIRFEDGRTYFGRAGGKEHGSFVHSQIKDYVDLTSEQFVARYPLGVDPMTKAVLVCIEEQLGLQCLLAEHIVYDVEWGVGTGIDLICWRPEKVGGGQLAGFVLIEVKTGYSGGCFDQPCLRNRYLRSPYFGHVTNSMLNCSRFQVLQERLLLERSHAGLRILDQFVVHAPDIHSPAVATGLGPLVSACREPLIRANTEAAHL